MPAALSVPPSCSSAPPSSLPTQGPLSWISFLSFHFLARLTVNPLVPFSHLCLLFPHITGHRSPPHMRDRDVPTYDPAREREQKMIEDPQARSGHPPSSSRREKPSRVNRSVPTTAPSSATASVTSDGPSARHRDYIPSEDVEYSHHRGGDRERERDLDRSRGHDELTRHANSRPMIPVDSVPPYSRSRHSRDYDLERMQPPVDHERLPMALDSAEQSSRTFLRATSSLLPFPFFLPCFIPSLGIPRTQQS